jgi:hypothetical protein
MFMAGGTSVLDTKTLDCCLLSLGGRHGRIDSHA